MSESTRPPVAEAREIVARALMAHAVSVNPGIANFAEGVLPYVYEPQADAVLLALRRSGHLAPATAPETEGIVVDVYGSSNMTPEQKAMLGEAVKRLFDAEDERERMIRAAFDAFYAEGTPYTESERAIFGQVVDAVLRRIAPATAPAGTEIAPSEPYHAAVSALHWVKDKDGHPFDDTDARRIAWCVFKAIHEAGYGLRRLAGRPDGDQTEGN